MPFAHRLCSLFIAVLIVASSARAADVTVFAAASLTDALKQIGAAYENETRRHTAFSFAASSALARQIEESSGADVFISADTDWMDHLSARGLIQSAGRVNLLANSLVLIAPSESAVTVAIEPHFDLVKPLHGGLLALADPSSVPAGKYAKAALLSLGVWDKVANRIAPAENVRVALAYVARGEAPLGVVYATDAKMEPRVRIVGTFPENSHPPIVYPAALTKDAKPGARAFLAYLQGARARAIFVRAGFTALTK